MVYEDSPAPGTPSPAWWCSSVWRLGSGSDPHGSRSEPPGEVAVGAA